MRKSLLALAAVTLLPLAAHAQNTINTVVGGGPTGLVPTSASLGVPVAVTQDTSGTSTSRTRGSIAFTKFRLVC